MKFSILKIVIGLFEVVNQIGFTDLVVGDWLCSHHCDHAVEFIQDIFWSLRHSILVKIVLSDCYVT